MCIQHCAHFSLHDVRVFMDISPFKTLVAGTFTLPEILHHCRCGMTELPFPTAIGDEEAAQWHGFQPCPFHDCCVVWETSGACKLGLEMRAELEECPNVTPVHDFYQYGALMREEEIAEEEQGWHSEVNGDCEIHCQCGCQEKDDQVEEEDGNANDIDDIKTLVHHPYAPTFPLPKILYTSMLPNTHPYASTSLPAATRQTLQSDLFARNTLLRRRALLAAAALHTTKVQIAELATAVRTHIDAAVGHITTGSMRTRPEQGHGALWDALGALLAGKRALVEADHKAWHAAALGAEFMRCVGRVRILIGENSEVGGVERIMAENIVVDEGPLVGRDWGMRDGGDSSADDSSERSDELLKLTRLMDRFDGPLKSRAGLWAELDRLYCLWEGMWTQEEWCREEPPRIENVHDLWNEEKGGFECDDGGCALPRAWRW